MKKMLKLILVTAFVVMGRTASAEDDFQYWSQYSVKVFDGEKIDLITFADARLMEDVSKLGLYYASQRLKMDFWEHLSLGLNYTYLHSRNTKPGANDEYKLQHRLELEANPSWRLKDWLKLSIRNRYEFRWIEDRGSYNDRFRHRWTFSFPLKNAGAVKSVYISSEGFYDIAEHVYNENRTVPIGVNVDISQNLSLNTFYMVQWKKGGRDWSSNQILGTLLSWEF